MSRVARRPTGYLVSMSKIRRRKHAVTTMNDDLHGHALLQSQQLLFRGIRSAFVAGVVVGVALVYALSR